MVIGWDKGIWVPAAGVTGTDRTILTLNGVVFGYVAGGIDLKLMGWLPYLLGVARNEIWECPFVAVVEFLLIL